MLRLRERIFLCELPTSEICESERLCSYPVQLVKDCPFCQSAAANK